MGAQTSRISKSVYFETGLRGSFMDEAFQECDVLQWAPQNTLQRKGRSLEPTYFNEAYRRAFCEADAKAWQSFLDTGAMAVVLPPESVQIHPDRIVSRLMRNILTNKHT